MKRDLAEERGNLRAGIAMLVLALGSFALVIELELYVIAYFIVPLAVAGTVFGVVLSVYHAWGWRTIERRIRALTRLPAARVIERRPGDTTALTARVHYPTAR